MRARRGATKDMKASPKERRLCSDGGPSLATGGTGRHKGAGTGRVKA